jgi:adenylate kinase family enzyme
VIVIIGAAGHGKSTLAKAIEQLSNVKCEVLNTQDLFEIKKEQEKTLQDLQEKLI